jgi:hypothetical protein
MPKECELLSTCGFFVKYQRSEDLTCRGFMNTFCRGDQMDQCRRKQIRKETGKPPVDDMMPNGFMMPGRA